MAATVTMTSTTGRHHHPHLHRSHYRHLHYAIASSMNRISNESLSSYHNLLIVGSCAIEQQYNS